MSSTSKADVINEDTNLFSAKVGNTSDMQKQKHCQD